MKKYKFPFYKLYYDIEPHPCDGQTGRDLFYAIYTAIAICIMAILFTVHIVFLN